MAGNDYDSIGSESNWKKPGQSLREREDVKAAAKDTPRLKAAHYKDRVNPKTQFSAGSNKPAGQNNDKPGKATGRPAVKVGRDTPAAKR